MLEGLRDLLEASVDVIYMVVNEKSLVDAISRTSPDLIIVDLSMPVSSEGNVVRMLRKFRPEIPVIVLSVHDDRTVLDECLASGVKGIVLKRTAINDLVPAVEAVMGGRNYVSPSITAAPN